MGELTNRGKAVEAGYAALDDDLTMPDRTGGAGASDTATEAERQDPGVQDSTAGEDPAPGPADIPAMGEVPRETSDDPEAADRETRTS